MNYVFFCPRPEAPSGGCWLIHHLAQLAVDSAMPAYVLQTQAFNVWWDAQPISPELIHTRPFKAAPDDVLVIPEVLWPKYEKLSMNKVLFLQNYLWLETIPKGTPVLTCSRYMSNHAKRLWDVEIRGELTPFLEDNLWFFAPKVPGSVVLFTRRNPYSSLVQEKLTEAGFHVACIDRPISKQAVANLLSTADYYVHLTSPEGFPAACAEAMRSQAVVVGTTGGGGNELMFHRETSWNVQDPKFGHYSDPLSFAWDIVDGVTFLRDHEADRERIRQRAYQWSLRYNKQLTAKQLKRYL